MNTDPVVSASVVCATHIPGLLNLSGEPGPPVLRDELRLRLMLQVVFDTFIHDTEMFLT